MIKTRKIEVKAHENSAYRGDVTKSRYEVTSFGEVIGTIEKIQHRIQVGSSYIVGWQNDFSAYYFLPSGARRSEKRQAWTLAEAKALAASSL